MNIVLGMLLNFYVHVQFKIKFKNHPHFSHSIKRFPINRKISKKYTKSNIFLLKNIQ